MLRLLLSVCVVMLARSASAQSPLPAVDVRAPDIQAFIKNLPKDAVSDHPIRVVDVGGYKVGTYGVFRPRTAKQEAVLHETKMTEVYYVIEGGVSRRIAKGDVVIIPAGVPHWWSNLEGDLSYLIIRPDPEGTQKLK